MTDAVRKLRQMAGQNWLGGMKDRRAIATDAADEIERLRATLLLLWECLERPHKVGDMPYLPWPSNIGEERYNEIADQIDGMRPTQL